MMKTACKSGFSFDFLPLACYNSAMKNQPQKKEVLRFPFRFSKTLKILSIAALFLCVLGVVVSVFRIVKYGVNGFNDFIRYPFLILICVFAIILVVSLLIKSEYVVSEKYLHSNFGLIKSKTELKNVTSVVVDLQEEKVTVYTGEAFFVMLLKKEQAQAFSKAVLDAKPGLELSFSLTENKPQDDEKKE